MSFAARLTRFIARQTLVKPARMGASRPIASISFDDFPKSAWTVAGPLLARHRARGTYYTAGMFCGRTMDGTQFYDADDLAQLSAAGHEIGCHGFSHQPSFGLSQAVLEDDAARNAAFLKPFLNGGAAESYAFPFGAASIRTKRFQARRYNSVRGVHPGINQGRVDLGQLNAVGVEARNFREADITGAIARARANNAWVIFYTHDVSDSPNPYGATPGMLNFVLERLAAAGVEVLPVREALPVALGEKP